jgi:hypothetical protein
MSKENQPIAGYVEGPLGFGHIPRPRKFTRASTACLGTFPYELPPAVLTQYTPACLARTIELHEKSPVQDRGPFVEEQGANYCN